MFSRVFSPPGTPVSTLVYLPSWCTHHPPALGILIPWYTCLPPLVHLPTLPRTDTSDSPRSGQYASYWNAFLLLQKEILLRIFGRQPAFIYI